MIDELTRTFRLLAEAVAARARRTPDDHRVRAFTGAVLGVMMTTLEPLAADPGMQWTGADPGPGRGDGLPGAGPAALS